MENDALRDLKKAFFAYRNGIVADMLRRSGAPYPFIMGCQLTDIITITRNYQPDVALADALWACRNHRECRLAATMLHPAGEMTLEKAQLWCADVQCYEEADVLCHRLLRHIAQAPALLQGLIDNPSNAMSQYIGYRLMLNLLLVGRVASSPILRKYVEDAMSHADDNLRPVLTSILEEFHDTTSCR